MKTMKSKLSSVGLIVGALAGVVAGAFLGSWILWLGLGVVIGLAAGTVRARRLSPGEPVRRLSGEGVKS